MSFISNGGWGHNRITSPEQYRAAWLWTHRWSVLWKHFSRRLVSVSRARLCFSSFFSGAESVVERQQQLTHRRRSQRGIWAGTSAKRGASLGSLAPRFETPLFWVLPPARTALDAALRTGRGEEEHPVQISSLPSPIHASGGPTTGFPLRYPGTVCTMKARGGGGAVVLLVAPETDTPPAH